MSHSITTLKSQPMFRNGPQIYINRAIEDFNLPLHDHEFIEFAYVAEGGGFHHINNEVYRVHKGDLCYIPIGVPHVFRPATTNISKHPLIVYNCVLSLDLLFKLASACSNNSTLSFIESLSSSGTLPFSISDQNEAIEKIFFALHREYSIQQEDSDDFLQALVLQLLLVIKRIKEKKNYRPPSDKLTLFDQLLSYVDQHFHEDLKLSELAKISMWSERHLQRLFQRHTEQNFSRYLQSLRIQKSQELLRSTQLKVSAIAEMVGYKDFGYFLTVFKRIVGTTPSQYRQSLD